METTKITKLEEIANEQRKIHLSRNDYNFKEEYGSTHPDAISDGDEKGKGENNGQIGSSEDIQARTSNIVKNTYQRDKGYGSTHPNAISDGDEKGKGENDNKVGSSVDIEKRTFSVAKNEYNIKKQYPDF